MSASLPLRALAPAKINLGLFLGPTRADGRHELVSVMQSISLADELTLELAIPDPSQRAAAGPHTATRAGALKDEIVCPGVPGPGAENLAALALTAFRRATGWDAPPLRLHIHKRVPVAAGLGGGSGDAAAALRLAAAASGIDSEELLLRIARELGADVPAQVRPGRSLAGGAGEQLTALPDPEPAFGVLLLPLAQALSTADVYAQADRLALPRSASELAECRRLLQLALRGGAQLPPAELLHNDLQAAARALCPEIDAGLAQARDAGADHVLLSGSGPTVLGLFTGEHGPERARAAAAALAARDPAPLAATPVAHLERGIWPQALRRMPSRAEREAILGYGPDGV